MSDIEKRLEDAVAKQRATCERLSDERRLGLPSALDRYGELRELQGQLKQCTTTNAYSLIIELERALEKKP